MYLHCISISISLSIGFVKCKDRAVWLGMACMRAPALRLEVHTNRLKEELFLL